MDYGNRCNRRTTTGKNIIDELGQSKRKDVMKTEMSNKIMFYKSAFLCHSTYTGIRISIDSSMLIR